MRATLSEALLLAPWLLLGCAGDRPDVPSGRPVSSQSPTVLMPHTIATLPWSTDLLPEPRMELPFGPVGQPRTSWLAPLLRADPEGRLWLAGTGGRVLRGPTPWERVDLPVPGMQLQGLAPQAGGGAVMLLSPGSGAPVLVAVDPQNRITWRTELADPAGPGGHPVLLQDEKGTPYLFSPDTGGAVREVVVTSGQTTTVTDLPGFNAPVLVQEGAVWRIQYSGERRRWIRRPFGGTDQEVSAAEPLQNTMWLAVAVEPDGGPLLTDGARLAAMSPAGVLTEIPLPPAGGPRVIDLQRACLRPNGAVWVVAADERAATVHELAAVR